MESLATAPIANLYAIIAIMIVGILYVIVKQTSQRRTFEAQLALSEEQHRAALEEQKKEIDKARLLYEQEKDKAQMTIVANLMDNMLKVVTSFPQTVIDLNSSLSSILTKVAQTNEDTHLFTKTAFDQIRSNFNSLNTNLNSGTEKIITRVDHHGDKLTHQAENTGSLLKDIVERIDRQQATMNDAIERQQQEIIKLKIDLNLAQQERDTAIQRAEKAEAQLKLLQEQLAPKPPEVISEVKP